MALLSFAYLAAPAHVFLTRLPAPQFINTVVTGATFAGADLAGSVWEDALIGSQDVGKLCENPTLTGDSRMQVGGQRAGRPAAAGHGYSTGTGTGTAVVLASVSSGSRWREDGRGTAGCGWAGREGVQT